MASAKLTFASLGVMQTICECVSSLHITTPTPIQKLAIPSLLQTNSHHLLAAQTGTGKTLAYLLPVLHQLKAQELLAQQRLTRPNSPRALILVPNRELSGQLSLLLRSFKHTVRLKNFSVHSGVTSSVIRKELNEGLDLLISTPEYVRRCVDWGVLRLNRVENFVFDESDTLVDAGMSGVLHQYIKKLQKTRFVFVGATHPQQLERVLQEHFSLDSKGSKPALVKLVAADTHLNLANIRHELTPLTSYDKNPQFLSILQTYHSRISRGGCIVFCNSINSARATEYFLRQNGYQAVSLHSEVPSEQRAANVDKFRMGVSKVLVCTDLGSRGLDFPGVELVVQYDFPKTTSDYLHRVGRTGRAGKLGLAVSLYRKKDLDLIKQLQASFQTNKPLAIAHSAYSLKNREDFSKQN